MSRIMTALLLSLSIFLTGCSGQESNSKETGGIDQEALKADPAGYKGGCADDPIAMYTQNEISPQGALYREDVRVSGGDGAMPGDIELSATGWYEVPDQFQVQDQGFELNPSGFRTEFWFYVPDIGWFADASVRSVEFHDSGSNMLSWDESIDPLGVVDRPQRCELMLR